MASVTNVQLTSLPARLSRYEAAYKKVGPHFQRFLQRFGREQFAVCPSLNIVLNTLEAAVPRLQERLGDRFLGLALMGKMTCGLGHAHRSSVDFRVYVAGAQQKEIEECVRIVRQKLRTNGLTPTKCVSFYDFEDQVSMNPRAIASVFTNYFIGSHVDLTSLGQKGMSTLTKQRSLGKIQLEGELEEEYLELAGCDENKVVELFLQENAQNFMSDEEAIALSYQYPFTRFLVDIARPYVDNRIEMLPFPEMLRSLFNEDSQIV